MNEPAAQKRILVAALLTSLAAIGAGAALGQVSGWENWMPATCMPDRCFCEAVVDGSIRQPVNTWSNLGFILIGILIILRGEDDLSARGPGGDTTGNSVALMRNTPVYSWIYGAAMVVLGFSSFFYHASLTFVGQWFDVMGMYVLVGFMLAYNVSRLTGSSPQRISVVYATGLALGAWLLIAWPEARRWAFAALVLVAVGAELAVRRRVPGPRADRLLVGSLALLVLAFGIWLADLKGWMCSPQSCLQGHGAWHLLCSASAGLFYLYYRSEGQNQAV